MIDSLRLIWGLGVSALGFSMFGDHDSHFSPFGSGFAGPGSSFTGAPGWVVSIIYATVLHSL